MGTCVQVPIFYVMAAMKVRKNTILYNFNNTDLRYKGISPLFFVHNILSKCKEFTTLQLFSRKKYDII